MMTLLLIVIFITFIGLGVPDSVLGSAWPAMFKDLSVSVSAQSVLTVLISAGTVTASVFSARLINKFGTGLLTCLSTVLSCFCLLAFSLAPSFWYLVLLSFPLGAGAGAIDASLNNFVAVHYKSTQMNFLHSFYGVGVALSPYLMSFALADGNDWRAGYRTVFFIMLAVSVITILALPLWKKAKKLPTESAKEVPPKNLTIKQMSKMPAVRIGWVVYFSATALEFTCGIWGCTYLVSAEGLSEAFSAKLITLYYIGMTLGRLLSGVVSTKFSNLKIVSIGYTIVGGAIALLLLPIPPAYKGVALLLIGFGNGPTFPNLIYLTPKFFGKENSQAIIGSQLAVCNLGILLIPPLFGVLAGVLSLKLFPPFVLALFIFMLLSTIIYIKHAKKEQKSFNY
ncbi:MAG: MFS transporter [Clostridia bacterium]|nr:MFS transporter [Clostridia bacterium]